MLFMKCPHIESAYTQHYTKHIIVKKVYTFKLDGIDTNRIN